MRAGVAAAAGLFCLLCTVAARADGIQLPADGDDYSALVAKAQAQDASVDFHALRIAYTKSRARDRAANATPDYFTLRKDMADAMHLPLPDGASRVREKAEQILSLDYTDMQAHKILRQACTIQHDDACANLNHFVEFGLLNSILHSGDGKTCATGWEVIDIKEEYFIVGMMGMKPSGQALVADAGHSCDELDATDQSGAAHMFFFNIDIVRALEQAMFQPKQ